MGFIGKGMAGIKLKLKAQMDAAKAKIEEAKKKAEKERDEKGLTTEEYIEAKTNGTLDSLPVVNSSVSTSDTAISKSNTPMYIMGAVLLGLGVWYILKKKKK